MNEYSRERRKMKERVERRQTEEVQRNEQKARNHTNSSEQSIYLQADSRSDDQEILDSYETQRGSLQFSQKPATKPNHLSKRSKKNINTTKKCRKKWYFNQLYLIISYQYDILAREPGPGPRPAGCNKPLGIYLYTVFITNHTMMALGNLKCDK
jgi:hypothetical protein